LIATGLKRRWLGIPGERELLGRGVSLSANRDRTVYAGKPVVVIGGGTGAVEDALLCAEVGCPVTLLNRSARFRARTDFLDRARKNSSIRIILNAEARRILGKDSVEGIDYRTKGSRVTRTLKADGVFVRIGWEPRTELLRRQLALDRAGYVRVRPGGLTAVPGVFAAGDVCSPRCPTIANAAGQGAAAAWEMARLLGRVTG
jgi:thioredoxin reductase (NADPH)